MPDPTQTLFDSRQAVSPSPRNDSERKYRWCLGLLLVALVGVGLFLLQRRSAGQSSRAKAAPSAPPLPITTAVARKGDIGIHLNALGTVTPVNTVAVKSRVDGQLVSVNYKEGQMVHEGDSLVEIDPGPFQAQLTQME